MPSKAWRTSTRASAAKRYKTPTRSSRSRWRLTWLERDRGRQGLIMQIPTQRTIIGAAWPQEAPAQALKLAAAVALGVCLLTLSAKFQVPFWPVPMTLQTLVVLMIGMAYGARLGGGTVLAYLLVGAMGMPVFAGTPERGIGLAYMMGPTGGFLLGFLLAAWLVGALAERGWDRSIWRCGLAMAIGTIVILLAGVAWLTPSLGVARAYEVGVAPFLLATTVKVALGAIAMPLIWRLLAQGATELGPRP